MSRTTRRLAATALTLAATLLAPTALAPAAQAANLSDVLDNPSYWQAGNQADIYQWVNMSYGSSHPRYSTHRVDVLLDDGGRPVGPVTYLRLTTNFSAISGTTSSDEFVSAVQLPAGVRISDSSTTPLFCRLAPGALISDATVPFQLVTDSSCRQAVKDMGQNVFAVNDRVLNRGDVWEVYVPITADRSYSASEGVPVVFAATHANQDATEPAIAQATNVLTIGSPSKSPSSSSAKAKAGARCSKAGARSGVLKCVKVAGKLVWKRA